MSTTDDETTGAISTEEDQAPVPNNTPPVEDDATGVNQAQASEAGQSPSRQGPDFNPAHVPGNAKRIIAYLMGADASHPDSIEHVGRMIDPDGRLPPADRNLMALDHVREHGGDQAAWPLMQANRVAYNAQSAFGKVALQGSPQKPADINAAIDAANKAQSNVLDGSNIQFARDRTGVTATVTIPGTTQPQRIQLSPQAFAAFLDVGGDGQWDKIMERSAPATLQRLAQQYPVQAAPRSGGMSRLSQMRPMQPQQAAPQQEAPQPSQQEQVDQFAAAHQAPDSDAVRTGQAQAKDVTAGDQPANPGSHDARGRYLGPKAPNNSPYDENIQRQGEQMFRGQPVTSEQDKQKYMSSQQSESDKRENAIAVATEKGNKANERAEISGGWRFKGAEAGANAKVKASENYSDARIKAAQVKLQAELARESAVNSRSDRAIAMRGLNNLIATGQMDKMTPEQKSMFEQLTKAPQQQQAPQQRAAPQQSGQDREALSWAQSHPNDPRAAQIKQRLGVQ